MTKEIKEKLIDDLRIEIQKVARDFGQIMTDNLRALGDYINARRGILLSMKSDPLGVVQLMLNEIDLLEDFYNQLIEDTKSRLET